MMEDKTKELIILEMTSEPRIPIVLFVYGESGCGKTLLSEVYARHLMTECYRVVDVNMSYDFKKYAGEKVIVLENDVYKNHYFEIQLLIQFQMYNRCKGTNLKPEVLLIFSRTQPDAEIQRILKDFNGATHVIMRKMSDTLNAVLDRLGNQFNVKNGVMLFKREKEEERIKKELAEKKAAQEKAAKEKVAQEKKPTITLIEKFDKTVQEKKTVDTASRAMKFIIEVPVKSYTAFSTELQENNQLRFYLASLEKETIWVFAVFLKTVDVKSKYDEIYHKAYPSYWESIEYIWKKGTFIDKYQFKGYNDFKYDKETAAEILGLSDEDAKSTLTLDEYYMYKKIKKQKQDSK